MLRNKTTHYYLHIFLNMSTKAYTALSDDEFSGFENQFKEFDITKKINIGKIIKKSGDFELADRFICQYAKYVLTEEYENSSPSSYGTISSFLDQNKSKKQGNEEFERYKRDCEIKDIAFSSLFKAERVGDLEWLSKPHDMSPYVFEFYRDLDEYKVTLEIFVK